MDQPSFSPEFLEKAQACTSKEDIIKLAASMGQALPDEVLDGIADGEAYPFGMPYGSAFGDDRCDIDPSAAPEAYRLGQVGYADLDW